MKPEIKEVLKKKDLKTFVKFPMKLYKDNPYFVPQLIMDELELFDRKKNPAYEYSDSRLFLAYHDGELVGRIAAVLNKAANTKYETKNLRWSWFDTINDYDVAEALFLKVEEWAKELGMETLSGPHGFSDLDQEAMIVEGFDTLPTIVGFCNLPYSPEFTEKFGFTKDIDYFEYVTHVPENGIPEKLLRIVNRIKERSSVRILEFKSKKEVLKRGPAVFEVIDEAFAEIYGATPLTRRQIDYYVNKYIGFLDKKMIKVAVNEDDEVVAFMFTVPSLSKAFQKAKGRIFPFGWYHLLKAMKQRDVLDFYLAGVKTKYQGKGIDLMMVMEMVKMALNEGFNCAESNLELETNTKVQAQWKHFGPKKVRVRRVYKKTI